MGEGGVSVTHQHGRDDRDGGLHAGSHYNTGHIDAHDVE